MLSKEDVGGDIDAVDFGMESEHGALTLVSTRGLACPSEETSYGKA